MGGCLSFGMAGVLYDRAHPDDPAACGGEPSGAAGHNALDLVVVQACQLIRRRSPARRRRIPAEIPRRPPPGNAPRESAGVLIHAISAKQSSSCGGMHRSTGNANPSSTRFSPRRTAGLTLTLRSRRRRMTNSRRLISTSKPPVPTPRWRANAAAMRIEREPAGCPAWSRQRNRIDARQVTSSGAKKSRAGRRAKDDGEKRNSFSGRLKSPSRTRRPACRLSARARELRAACSCRARG